MNNAFKVKKSLLINASGSTALDIQGNSGQLFSVEDTLTGSLMSVNDISGLPILEVFDDDRVVMGTFGSPGLIVSGSSIQTGDTTISGGALGVNVTPSETAGRIDAGNDIVAYSSSDKRWKTNIKPIQNSLKKLANINGVEFDWIVETEVHGNKGHDIGIIAQEVESIFPEIVQIRDSGMKAVRYEKLIPLLIEAIKEQQRQIDYLTSKIK